MYVFVCGVCVCLSACMCVCVCVCACMCVHACVAGVSSDLLPNSI